MGKLKLGQVWLYSAASAGLNIMSIPVSTWLLYFYAPPTDSGRIQYLPATLVGVLLTLGSLWDAVIDPFIGYWSDNLRSRWGRRRAFMLLGAPIVAIFLVLLWMPPKSGGFLTTSYFVLVTLGYFTTFSLVGIPYDATLPEMAPDAHSRVSLSYWKNVFGLIGVLIGSLAAAPLFDQLSPVAMGLVVGVVGLGSIWLSTLVLKDLEPAGSPLGAFAGVKSALQNRQFLIMFISTLFVHLGYQILLANLPYFVTLVVGLPESDVAIFLGVLIVVMGLVGPLWTWLDKHFSQRTLLLITMFGLAIAALLPLGVGLFPGGMLFQGIMAMLLLAAMLGGYFILAYAMMGNVADYDEMLTGQRREAIYYGTFSFANGLGISLGALMLPILLEKFGYSTQNPLGVRLAFVAIGITSLVGALVFLPYRLGDSLEETRQNLNLSEVHNEQA